MLGTCFSLSMHMGVPRTYTAGAMAASDDGSCTYGSADSDGAICRGAALLHGLPRSESCHDFYGWEACQNILPRIDCSVRSIASDGCRASCKARVPSVGVHGHTRPSP